MTEKLTYADLSDEDKLLMDGLFQYKAGKEVERKIIRNIIAQLRKREMNCTKDIMSLSTRAIGEKFDLGANSAKPLSKKNRKNIKKKITENLIERRPAIRQQQIMGAIARNEKKICSENGHKSINNCGRIKKNSMCHR